MVPWPMRRVTDRPNAKLREMQQNTHRLVQLISAATPEVPNQTLMPQLSKQMLNACPIPPMHIAPTDGDGGGDCRLGRSEKTSAGTSIDGDGGGDSKIGITKEMDSTQHRLCRPVKNTAHRPLWAGGQQFEKKVFPPPFFGVFCGFSEENIVFVLHYDLKCIFQDN